MPKNEFRAIYMPYCIDQLDDGRYVVLNRNYKPLGFYTKDHIKYEDYPIAVKFKGLTRLVASKISYKGDEDTKRIYLYNDGCVPTESKEDMNAYLERLRILAKLKIAAD